MYYSASITKTEYQFEKKRTESQVTEDFQRFFYAGCGHKFLGYDFSSEISDTGRAKIPGPRYWDVPQKEKHKWSPVRDHLAGRHRGIVRGTNETHLPCVTDDLDRHDGTIKATKHIKAVLDSYKLLTTEFNELMWLAEVNPRNGSTKFFGFDRQKKPLKVSEANEIGKRLNERQKASSIGAREVFPDNSPQVFLPMRLDKITIVDTGILEKTKRYRLDRLPGTNESQRVYFEAYSLWGFYEWLKRGEHCDLQTLEVELKKACAYTPDIDIEQPTFNCSTVKTVEMLPPKEGADISKAPDGEVSSKALCKALEEIRSIPDAFEKNTQMAFFFNNQARRPLQAEELLAKAKEHNIYNGNWEDGLSNRINRIKGIAKFAAKTFDPKKCGSSTRQRPLLNKKMQEWRGRSHLLSKTLSTRINVETWVDEYGQVQYTKGRIVNGIQRDHVLRLAGIISHVSDTHDGDIPRKSIKCWWDELANENSMPEWKHNEYYLACRQVLIDNGWLKMNHDYSYQNNQSKKGWILYETELVGSVWDYPTDNNNNNRPYLYSCGAIANQKNRLASVFALLHSQRPPP